jgi:hypothetical protein
MTEFQKLFPESHSEVALFCEDKVERQSAAIDNCSGVALRLDTCPVLPRETSSDSYFTSRVTGPLTRDPRLTTLCVTTSASSLSSYYQMFGMWSVICSVRDRTRWSERFGIHTLRRSFSAKAALSSRRNSHYLQKLEAARVLGDASRAGERRPFALSRSRFSQPNTYSFSLPFEIYKIYTLLHRSDPNSLRFSQTSTFAKFEVSIIFQNLQRIPENTN